MKLPPHIIREIAVKARRDPRTVARVLNPDSNASAIATADVRDAMRELGIVDPTNESKVAANG